MGLLRHRQSLLPAQDEVSHTTSWWRFLGEALTAQRESSSGIGAMFLGLPPHVLSWPLARQLGATPLHHDATGKEGGVAGCVARSPANEHDAIEHNGVETRVSTGALLSSRWTPGEATVERRARS